MRTLGRVQHDIDFHALSHPGVVGYGLQKELAIFADSRWTGAVIWPQVWFGLGLIPVAVFCWFRAVRETDRRLGLK